VPDNVANTVKKAPSLEPSTVATTIFPVVPADGTGTATEVALQLVGVAVVPLNLTVLLPWVDPKLLPVIVTEVPTVPEVGERPVMLGNILVADPVLQKFEGELWLLYAAAIQSLERTVFDTSTSSIFPLK